jgi:predicted anti-sigma-YlaC factor YlaD
MTAYESTTSRLIQQELGACALVQDLLPLYIESEVSPASRDLIAEHLSQCERCAGFLAGARSVRDQLRRDTMLRQSSVAQDQTAHQAIVRGQRRVAALVLAITAMLCLTFVAAIVAVGFFRTPLAAAPAPEALPVMTTATPWGDPLEAELQRRALEEAGLFVHDPPAGQLAPPPELFPTPTPVPAPSIVP